MNLVSLRRIAARGMGLLVLVPIAMLYLSGLLGLLWWPPPSFAAYTTIIQITDIGGPLGGLLRIVGALIALIGLVLPWRPIRVFLYLPALVSTLLFVLGFMDAGQGFATGTWTVGGLCACIGLVCDEDD